MRAASFIIVGAFLFKTASPGAVTYDPVQEFSTNSNPSGVWTYGYLTALDGPFSIATDLVGAAWTVGCTTNQVTMCATRIAIEPGTEPLEGIAQVLVLENYPLTWNNIPTLRFTAPANGNYKVEVTAASAVPGNWFHVRVNGVETFFARIPFFGRSTNYFNTLTLSQSDTLDLVGSEVGIQPFPQNRVYLVGTLELLGPAGVAVWASPTGGLFTNSASISLFQTSTNGAIRYTLNGANPSSNSDTYTNPITITNATEVRAAVFDGGAMISQVLTSSFARVYAIDDGIPASWREQYFGPGYLTDPRVAADADPDGDLSTNWEEYLAGTNPLDNTSGFRANVFSVPKLEFGSQSNRVYRILRGQSPDTNVTAIATVTATNSVTTYVDPVPLSPGSFYLIELLP